ncbi:hypothetical protein MEQ_04303 [Candida albicans P87]|nr:hypothetical protein MEQ_04303 [Candida albicans P87]
MLTFKGLLLILLLPSRLLSFIIKYPFIKGIPGKYQHNFSKSLFIKLCRLIQLLPVSDKGTLNFISTNFLLNKIMKLYHTRHFLGELNNFGKKFDDQSYWIHESPNRNRNKNKSDDPIIVYLHGGSYYFDNSLNQMESLIGIYQLLQNTTTITTTITTTTTNDDSTSVERKKNLSILVLDYKLASKGYKMPYQLNQLISTYKNLIYQGNTNLILMGDSAGGNLAITFLQHLRLTNNNNNNNNNNSPANLPYPKSLILISPWCKIVPEISDYTKGHSMYDNNQYDIIEWKAVKKLIDNTSPLIRDDLSPQNLIISPGNLPYNIDDWIDIDTLQKSNYSTFVIMGEYETLRDDILNWCQYAVNSTLSSPIKHTQGIFDKNIHQFVSTKNDGAYVKCIIEPKGIHDASMIFENDILKEFQKHPTMNLQTINKDKYFGIYQIVEFLNEIL